MRYKINDVDIRSENAAKSVKQKSTYLHSVVREFGKFDNALDYGCGKLRNSILLHSLANKIMLVDSRIQITRRQIIDGNTTSVLEYAKNHLPKARTIPAESINDVSSKFDFVLCSNVLSAIPFLEEQINLLKNIRRLLKKDGFSLIVTQYSDQYFTRMLSNPESILHLDGWISKKAGSYYGIIDKEKLQERVQGVGLRVVRLWTKNGSAYTVVSKSSQFKRM